MRHKTEPCTSLGLINPHTHTTVDKKKVAEKYQQSDTKQSCKKKKNEMKWESNYSRYHDVIEHKERSARIVIWWNKRTPLIHQI